MKQKTPSPYRDFNLLPIAGRRREGAAGRELEVTDPYRGDALASIPMASEADLDEAYDMPVNDDANAPFGGEKNSGLGRFNGDWAIDEFTTDQWITVQTGPRPYPF